MPRSNRKQRKGTRNAKAGERGNLDRDARIAVTQGKRERSNVGPPTITRVPAAGGVADTARVTLRYVERVALTSTTGLYALNVYRGNGPFDPNQTGTGAQPAWYDDYSAMYNRQRTMASRVTVEWHMVTNSGLGIVAGVMPQHVTTSSGDDVTAMTQPYLSSVAVSAYQPGKVTTQAISTSKFLGYPGTSVLGSDALESIVSTTPSHQWYWHVWAMSADHSTTLAAAAYVSIDYDILFFDKVDTSDDYYNRLKAYKEAKRVVPVADKNSAQREKKDPGDQKANDQTQQPAVRPRWADVAADSDYFLVRAPTRAGVTGSLMPVASRPLPPPSAAAGNPIDKG